jgi:hypothetical protein
MSVKKKAWNNIIKAYCNNIKSRLFVTNIEY